MLLNILVVIGLRDDGGYVSTSEYTTAYSAVIKMGRTFIFDQSYVEQQGEIGDKIRRIDEAAAGKQTRSLYRTVREKVLGSWCERWIPAARGQAR